MQYHPLVQASAVMVVTIPVGRTHVHFDVAGQPAERENDFVLVLVGGVPPYELLKQCGVDLETRFGTPILRSA